jgi:hypothetical protein
MTWASGWAASLAQGPGRLRVVLGPIGAPAQTISADEIVGPVIAQGAELQLRRWATAAPRLRVQVAGDPVRLATLRVLQQGITAQVHLETAAGEERIWAGPLLDVTTPRPGLAELTIDDPTAWALARHRGASPDWRAGLFADSTVETTLAALGTPGTGSIQVVETTLAQCFAAHPGSTRRALVEIDGQYLYLATNESVGLISGLDILQYDATVAPTTFASGTPVRIGPLIEGSPLDVLLRVLLSSGAASGGYDIMAADQGMGVPASLVDTTDAARLAPIISVPGRTDRFTFGVVEPTAAPEGGEVLAWCAALGLWPTLRQGALTVRAAVDPWGAAWAALYAGEVSDETLVAVGAHTTRAPDTVPEHLAIGWQLVLSGGFIIGLGPGYDYAGALWPSTAPQSWPATTQTYDLGWPGGGLLLPVNDRARFDATAAYDDHLFAVAARLAPWARRRCEAVEVTMRGEALGWCAGDLVGVTSRSIPGPVATGGVAVARRALWVPQSWDWTAREVQGTLYLLSE